MMPVTRRLLALMTLLAILLQGIAAQPVSARQCLRVQASEYCVTLSGPVASYGDHATPLPAVLPAETELLPPEGQDENHAAPEICQAAQTACLPMPRPPRA